MRLTAGTVLYHGTNDDDFDDVHDRLNGPGWVSTSRAVAEHFAQRANNGGAARIIVYELREDLELPEIYTAREMAEFAEEHEIDMCSTEDIRDSVERSRIPGWILPTNYPNGDDILISDTSVLEHLRTEPCAGPCEEPSTRARARP